MSGAPNDPGPTEPGDYELVGEDAPEGAGGTAPKESTSPVHGLTVGPVLPYRRVERTAVPASALYFPSKPRDLYLPAGLLAAGMALGFGELVHIEGNAVRAARIGTVYFVMQAGFLLIAIPVLTRMVGVALGTLPQAALKLCAIATLPAAVGVGIGLLVGGCTGAVLSIPLSFCASWALFAVLFEMDLTESRLCAGVYYAVGAVVGAPILFGSMWIWDWL